MARRRRGRLRTNSVDRRRVDGVAHGIDYPGEVPRLEGDALRPDRAREALCGLALEQAEALVVHALVLGRVAQYAVVRGRRAEALLTAA